MATPGGNLRRASFRGVPFEVRRDARTGSRSLQIDRYPLSSRHRVINLGRNEDGFREEMYVADEANAQARMMALNAALEVEAPGLLILPARPPVMVWARSWEDSWESRQLGYFNCRVEFVEDGTDDVGAPSLGLAESIVGGAIGAVAGIAGAFGEALGGLIDSLGSFVSEAAAFISEGLAMFDMVASIATGIGDLADVVAGVGSVAGWAGLGDIFDGLSLAGDIGLSALETIALGEEWLGL
ncbi:hypothetical protein BOSE62_130663 [Bosea sp. 62]|uniref:DNA circularization N-terminal domain-containing protein n=1 Tax=unclassified Bosea (in: a-proteobacteria) TaxID=2653178 RepID=UPI001257660A|nr:MULTISPECIES: DNA circularization N-terminal domain-containing protein [unclassified Bosea (in: a-proteobacteria)]CAD5255701.1 hypothetical protein BOSE7B_120683 [Bosea sp. 7B]CAD5275072.1 hypothetical protein BOSE21B_30229 [Bosea sp. 21B]CAD5276205.1 hypothetical protein BOSE46_30090 [Bosea sp. 46]VVT60032.1 hypothetical protein BOS5A_210823 [Bosea sp. EC-HK365B]VXB52438.1 hypothetical protein BOSE62_130663 [Bosea sp. 62]